MQTKRCRTGDRQLAELALRQHGVVSLAQLHRLGLNHGAVAHRVAVGRLHTLHRGVYAVGHSELSTHGRFLAAVLAVGDDAAASHVSAAIAHNFWPRRYDPEMRVDISVPRRVRQRAGIRVYVGRDLPPEDTTRRACIPLTTPARTALDLAATITSDRLLTRVVHEAEVQRLVNQRQLRAQIARAGGQRGARRLAGLIAPGPAPTRSELEDRALELLHSHGFPKPLTNTLVAGIEVDFLFEDANLIVETDGKRFHDTSYAREADARKQAALEAAGYRLLRLTWDQITHQPGQTARRLRRAFAL